jgi:hypothetical protein
MDHLVDLLDSAIGYVALDYPNVVPALAEAREVVQMLAVQERAELAADLAGLERLESVDRQRVERNGPALGGLEVRDRSVETGFTRSAAGVRSALEEVLGYHEQMKAGHEPDVERYERAKDFLDGLPPMPGLLGQAVADVFSDARPPDRNQSVTGFPADPEGANLEASLNRLSRALGGRWTTSGEERPTPAVATERVNGLQDARDTALDRAIAATLRSAQMGAGGKPDPTIAADASSWATVHARAVEGLVRAGAADAPRAQPASTNRGIALDESLTVAVTNRSPVIGIRPAGLEPWW